MYFDGRATRRRHIAVVGGGISGMGAAYELSREHTVTLFESEPRLGGHARTVLAGRHGDQPVDTGFIVFNRPNYPNLVALFEELGVPIADSDMSFGASIDGGRLEYGLRSLSALTAQKANLARPAFWRMVRDILHFNRNGLAAASDPTLKIGDLLVKLGTGPWFRDHYLLPLSGAIWSVPASQIMEFPAAAMMRFFDNHALLHHSGQHQWFTVDGGSTQYVRRLESAMKARGVHLHLGTPVAGIRRTAHGAEVRAGGDEWRAFDEVVLACHSDQALALLSDATGVERTALSAVRYQPNRAVLHADSGVMPRRRAVWSSWNYAEAADRNTDRIDLTYWMNSLQPIPKEDPLFVTLNSTRPIREELIYDEVDFAHPVYDLGALAAQETIRAINGRNATWFCGAWMKNGFHEDGLSSGLEVARAVDQPQLFDVAAE